MDQLEPCVLGIKITQHQQASHKGDNSCNQRNPTGIVGGRFVIIAQENQQDQCRNSRQKCNNGKDHASHLSGLLR